MIGKVKEAASDKYRTGSDSDRVQVALQIKTNDKKCQYARIDGVNTTRDAAIS